MSISSVMDASKLYMHVHVCSCSPLSIKGTSSLREIMAHEELLIQVAKFINMPDINYIHLYM